MNWNNPSRDNNNKNNHDHETRYDCNTIFYIQLVYIISSLLWIFLIFALDLWKDDVLVMLILLLPLIVFVINFISLGDFACHMEDQMFKSNFLSFAFIVAIILINWNSPIGNHDKTEFFKIVIVAFILLMLSLLDLWVPRNKMSIVKHVKTSLQTASLALLALALYLYYVYHRDRYGYE